MFLFYLGQQTRVADALSAARAAAGEKKPSDKRPWGSYTGTAERLKKTIVRRTPSGISKLLAKRLAPLKRVDTSWIDEGASSPKVKRSTSPTIGTFRAGLEEAVTGFAKDAGVTVEIMQSDSETELIQILHRAADSKTPIVFNPAAFTHYSYAIRDAVVMLKAPIIEVHISNPLSREEFRHTSVISGVVNGTIAGFGLDSYRLAILALIKLVK